VLVARAGWTQASLVAALVLVLLGLPFLLSPARAPAGPRRHRPSLRSALARPEMRRGLALAAIYVATQKWGLFMLGPFLVDAGVGLDALGILNGAGGMILGFACALLGGASVRAWGARPVMVLALVFQAAALSGLAAAAVFAGAPRALLFTFALASSSGVLALGFVALYARFMALSDPRQAGIDFTLLQCMDALVSMAGGIGAGWVAEHFGFGACFGLAAGLAFCAAPAVAILAAPAARGGDARAAAPA
jgi:MFS transporter (putative signal transducer)